MEILEGKQRILVTAEALFTEHGYQAVSIRDIASACEMTNAALYYHFPNKAALFHEVIKLHATRLRDAMQVAAEEIANPRDKVVAMVGAYGRHIKGQRPPFFALRRMSPGVSGDEARDFMREMYALITAPLRDVIEAEMAAHGVTISAGLSPSAILIGMLHGELMRRAQMGTFGITEEEIENIVTIFWQGLGLPDGKENA